MNVDANTNANAKLTKAGRTGQGESKGPGEDPKDGTWMWEN